MKKILLFTVFLSCSTTHALSFYPFLGKLGSYADIVFSKGEVSKEHQRMFQEIVTSLGIENRNIKIKNSSLLIRLIGGYNNAFAVQYFNRVYFNESCLNEMNDEQKKFLMSHELTHHSKNHLWKRAALHIILFEFLQKNIIELAKKNNMSRDNYLYRYFTDGFGNSKVLLFSIWHLIEAQVHQNQETEADTEAILKLGVHPQDGVKLLEHLYYPKTDSWPLYAKLMQKYIQLCMPIMRLPIIKQHIPHLASFDERAKHIQQLEKEWEKRHGKQQTASKSL